MHFPWCENAASPRNIGDIEDVRSWELLGRYEPFFGDAGGTVGEFAVTDGVPGWLGGHWLTREVENAGDVDMWMRRAGKWTITLLLYPSTSRPS